MSRYFGIGAATGRVFPSEMRTPTKIIPTPAILLTQCCQEPSPILRLYLLTSAAQETHHEQVRKQRSHLVRDPHHRLRARHQLLRVPPRRQTPRLPRPRALQHVSSQDGGVGGCIVLRPSQKPTPDGALVFLNAEGKLDASLKRAENLGANIFVPRTEIPGGLGYFACLQDSEGNHVGLHSTMF
jgi:predicted enzyme related to lactoylglutathione lyase